MRKALIAVIVASALFAVGAFAASFTVQSEDIASGANGVDACAELVRITFDEPADDVDGAWTVSEVRVRFFDDAAGTVDGAGCAGFEADLALDLDTTGDGIAESSQDYTNTAVTTTSGVTTAVFNIGSVEVSQIVGASVVVDGAILTDETPPLGGSAPINVPEE